MKTGFLIEVFVILIIGLISIIDGIRLTTGVRIESGFDILGPGFYNIGIGSLVIIVGVIYFIFSRGKDETQAKDATVTKNKIRFVSMIAVMAIYAFLMHLIGYLVSTFVFFVLILRVVGFRSWLINVIVSIVSSISLYIVFVKWLNMIFPRGVLLNF